MSEGTWHRTTQRLRYSDNDAVGHVNNAIYATMFEAGRTELMDAAGIFERDGPLAGVIVRLEIDFKREMSWPGDVVVETAVAKFGTKSVHLRSRVLFNDTLAAEGVAILALIDRTTRRAVALGDDIRQKFAPWALPGV